MKTIIIFTLLLLASCHSHRQIAEQTYESTATVEHSGSTATHRESTSLRLHRLDSLLTTLHIDSLVLTVEPMLPDSLPVATRTTLRLYGLDRTDNRHSEQDDTATTHKEDTEAASIDHREKSRKKATKATESKTDTSSPWPPLIALLIILAAAGYVLYRSGRRY